MLDACVKFRSVPTMRSCHIQRHVDRPKRSNVELS